MRRTRHIWVQHVNVFKSHEQTNEGSRHLTYSLQGTNTQYANCTFALVIDASAETHQAIATFHTQQRFCVYYTMQARATMHGA